MAWLSVSVCSDVAAELDGLLARWADAWGLPKPGPVGCEPVAVGAAVPEGLVDLRAAPPLEWKRALWRALFQFDGLGSPVMDAVVEKVAQALARQLIDKFSCGVADEKGHGPLGHQGIQVVVEMLGQGCGFMLTCAQLRAVGRLPVPVARPMRGVNLEQALADVAVPLVARLGCADVNLDDLLQLAPGDVLLLKETLDAPLRVASPGSGFELSAHLGAVFNPPRRAVRWLAS